MKKIFLALITIALFLTIGCASNPIKPLNNGNGIGATNEAPGNLSDTLMIGALIEKSTENPLPSQDNKQVTEAEIAIETAEAEAQKVLDEALKLVNSMSVASTQTDSLTAEEKAEMAYRQVFAVMGQPEPIVLKFATGSSELTAEMKTRIKSDMAGYTAAKITCGADNVGSAHKNAKLSKSRGLNTWNFLKTEGIPMVDNPISILPPAEINQRWVAIHRKK